MEHSGQVAGQSALVPAVCAVVVLITYVVTWFRDRDRGGRDSGDGQ